MREASGPGPAALIESATMHLDRLCSVEPDRRPGSDGNRAATGYAAEAFERHGWDVARPAFEVMDWRTDGGIVRLAASDVEITPSPYGLGVSMTGPIRVARTAADLAQTDFAGSILVLADGLAREPLTPKAFPFYHHDEHAVIIDRRVSSSSFSMKSREERARDVLVS